MWDYLVYGRDFEDACRAGRDGGYPEYVVTPIKSLVKICDNVDIPQAIVATNSIITSGLVTKTLSVRGSISPTKSRHLPDGYSKRCVLRPKALAEDSCGADRIEYCTLLSKERDLEEGSSAAQCAEVGPHRRSGRSDRSDGGDRSTECYLGFLCLSAPPWNDVQ